MTSHGRSNNLIDIESPSAEPQLQFQDFPVQNAGGAAKLDINSQTLTFTHVPETPGSSSTAGLSPGTPFSDGENLPAHSIWSIEFYKKLFDVNTDQVLDRILWAMIPKPGVNYLQHHIQSKPDLYGPVWICITLVFTIAISGNLANYLQAAASQKYHWKYDFHAVTFAATAIFAYAWLLPSVLWGILKWQGSQQESRVLAKKGVKRVHIVGNEHGENVTMITCASAVGSAIPPMILFECKQMKPEFAHDLSPSSVCCMCMTQQGSITTQAFVDLIEHFRQYNPPGPCLMIFDGAKSYLDFEIVEAAERTDEV